MRRMIVFALLTLSPLFLVSCRKSETSEAPSPATETAAATPAAATTPPAVSLAVPPTEGLPAGSVLRLSAEAGVTAAADGAVSSWASTPGSIQATQVDAAKQPRLVSGAVNNRPAVRFDGTEDILEAPLNINPSGLPSMTVVAVFRSETAEASPLRKLYGHDDGGYDRAVGLDGRAVKNYTIFGGESSVVPYFALEPNTWYLTVDSFSNNEMFSGWVNGRNVLDRAPMKHGDGLKTFFIGGTGTVYNEAWKGSIAELIVFDRVLDAASRRRLEESLAAKYGIALQPELPEGAQPQ